MKKNKPDNKNILWCWQYFNCKNTHCPSYKSKDKHCWLYSDTFCHDKNNDTWLEKMELCINCRVFKSNIAKEDIEDVLLLTARQFKNYKQEIEKEQNKLKQAYDDLDNFRRTSIYLLKELDRKNMNILKDYHDLDKITKETKKKLNNIEKKYTQSAKMMAMGRFSAGLAHEINNPLGAIINYLRMALASPQIKDQNRDYLELSLKGLFRIEKIVKDILSYSINDKPDCINVNINKLIHDTIAFIKYKCDNKNIRLILKLATKKQEICVNTAQMQQAFLNIINNAIDSLENKGKLIIETQVINNMIQIDFTDNGKGIGEENIDKVFDPFFTTKEVGEGTGMGLFISYNIIQNFNGSIEVKSKKRKGTTFTITLPVSSRGH